MKHFLITTLLAISTVLAEEARPTFLPFDVTVGGQKAEMKEGNDIFAVIEKPVKPDAPLVIGKEAPMLIINAFALQEDASVKDNIATNILVAQKTDTIPLSATMDKKPLGPGMYLLNIVANQQTARVVLTVEGPMAANMKLPSLEAVLGFFKKNAR